MKKSIANLILVFSFLLVSNLSAQYQKAESKDMDVYYRTFGEGQPLLIIGGGPGDASDRYLSLCELLSENCQCIMPDQRGTGKSLPTVFDSTTISVELTLADFEAVRKKLGFKKWNVLGFSYGGYLASLYAHFYPESISKLVLLGSAGLNTGFFGYFRDNIFSRMQSSDKDKYEFWADSARYVNNPNHALAEIVRAMMPGYFYDRKKSLIISEAIADTSFDIHGMGRLIWADIRKRDLDLEKMEQKFAGAILILHGRQDPLGESVPLSLSKYYKKSDLVFVEKAGHYSWVEQPDRIKENIKAFLKNKEDRAAYRITEKDLIPEGITYAASTNSFYLSSIKKTKIIQIDAESGGFKDFIPSDLLDLRFLGMITDDSRGLLWACGNKGRNSAVVKFNLKTGKIVKTYPDDGTDENIYNDLVQDKKGNAYFTNTNKQTVYKIDHQTDSVSVFFDDTKILHPNGITISPDNKYLFIASTENGIRILDMEKMVIINEPDTSINSTGLDGLKYYKNSLIGIQNEVRRRSDMKIAQYFLNDSGTKITRMKIIDQNGPYFDIPTTHVIVHDMLYCLANSQMGNIDFSTYKIRSYEHLDDIIILKYDLTTD